MSEAENDVAELTPEREKVSYLANLLKREVILFPMASGAAYIFAFSFEKGFLGYLPFF